MIYTIAGKELICIFVFDRALRATLEKQAYYGYTECSVTVQTFCKIFCETTKGMLDSFRKGRSGQCFPSFGAITMIGYPRSVKAPVIKLMKIVKSPRKNGY